MMIEVSDLTRSFGPVRAIDHLTFGVGSGQIVGFLGPNGAGKTTTLRILSCYLPATSGTARVAGFDVLRQSRQARARIAYLPESIPLYNELRVVEYLRFRAKLKGVSRRLVPARVEHALRRCGVADVANRILGHLSRGYRQRVGLADCLLHEPDILLLDEPTSGLDPNQRIEVRDLIRELGRDRTVFLSSHILAEVESVCDRVIVIKRGAIVGQGTPEELVERIGGGVRVRVELVAGPDAPSSEEVQDAVRGIGGVQQVEVGAEAGPDGSPGTIGVSIEAVRDQDPREAIFGEIVRRGWTLRELRRDAPTLEEIFVRLTREEGV